MKQVSDSWRIVALIMLIIYILSFGYGVYIGVQETKELEKLKQCYYEICANNKYINAYYEANVCKCYEIGFAGDEIIGKAEYMR